MKIAAQDIASILHIYAPYRVKSLNIDENKAQVVIKIEDTDASLFQKISRGQRRETLKSWAHIQIGHYSSVIELQTSADTFSKQNSINPPPFIGHPDRSYTHELMRSVLFTKNQGLPNDLISTLLNVSLSVIEDIIDKHQTKPTPEKHAPVNTSVKLPSSQQVIWQKLITNDTSLETANVGLRFLLSRFQLAHTNDPGNRDQLLSNSMQIHDFFIKNERALVDEYQQILDAEAAPKESSSQVKATLSPNHPIMDHILSQKLSLVDAGVALSLKLTNLRSRYKGADEPLKEELRNILFKYFKKQ
ncbi:MAG: hypothetical protein RPS47_03740, partial [Colwellia sp.]